MQRRKRGDSLVKKWLWGILVLLKSTLLWSSTVTSAVPHQILLPQTKIYVDHNRTTTIQTVQNKPFKPVKQESIGFGYSPNIDVWVKINLHNPTNKPIQKILEYSNPLTTHIELYDAHTQKMIGSDGLFLANTQRETLNPYFTLTLKPNQSKTYYLKASSTITALILRLDLWEPKAFYNKELSSRSMLSLFFGAMIIIILYNLIIYFIIKERSYLYYVLFFVSVTLHQFIYRGTATLYLPSDLLHLLVEYAAFVVAAPVFFLMLFTKEILHLEQYAKFNKFLNAMLIIYPVFIFLAYWFLLHSYRSMLSVAMLFVLFVITCYAMYRKNQQAKYLMVGWTLFWTAALFMYLSSIGVYDIFTKIPFYTERTLVFEALIFAFSLAMMIKQANQEKLDVQNRYIDLQRDKEHLLTQKVAEKTSELSKSLQEKDLLLKELNHRVKNSIQTIVSFLRLQIDETEDKKIQRTLTNIENRIMSINHLYALLHAKHDVSFIDANEYFLLIAKHIQKSFQNTKVKIEIQTTIALHSEMAVYCGFIMNEVITNALQHAFSSGEEGEIIVKLIQQKKHYQLSITDNGKGFDSTQNSNSLGLMIIESLATFQLNGTCNIYQKDGINIVIVWEER